MRRGLCNRGLCPFRVNAIVVGNHRICPWLLFYLFIFRLAIINSQLFTTYNKIIILLIILPQTYLLSTTLAHENETIITKCNIHKTTQ